MFTKGALRARVAECGSIFVGNEGPAMPADHFRFTEKDVRREGAANAINPVVQRLRIGGRSETVRLYTVRHAQIFWQKSSRSMRKYLIEPQEVK
jgi:hypothetical protein